MGITLSNLILVLISTSTLLYSVKFGLSPIYFLIPTGFFLYSIRTLYTGFSRFSLDMFFSLALIVYAFLIHFGELNGALINLILGLGVYICFRDMRSEVKKKYFMRVINWTLFISLLILSFDALWRFFHPIHDANAITHYLLQNTYFYVYKFNSPFFADSNLSGMAALSFGMLSLFLYRELSLKIYLRFFQAFFILTILSFSRSAIISIIILAFISKKSVNLKNFKVLTILLSLTGAAYFFSVSDESFQTKIDIYNIFTNNYLANVNYWDFLFGMPFGEFGKKYGIEAHSVYITYFCEMGFFGFLLFSFYVISVKSVSKHAFWYGLMPILTAGISYYVYAGVPFSFLIIAIIANIDNYLNNESRC